MADINIDNYTIDDILAIFNLTDPTPFTVQDVANSLIAKMTTEGRPDLVTFFTLARDKVLDDIRQNSVENLEVMNEKTEGLGKIWTDTSFESKTDNPIRYFSDGAHVTAEQKLNPLGINAANQQPIIATHIISIDSQYRSTILPYSNNPLSNSFNTNFTFNITSPITRVISLRLYSYHIPTTWYAFSASAGNTFLIYNGIIITIPDGNYTITTLVAAINTQAQLNSSTNGLVVSYNATSNRVSFTNTNTLSGPISIVFFIQSNILSNTDCGVRTLHNLQTLGINTTLGWLLGFRTTPDSTTGNMSITLQPLVPYIADVAPDTYGPKYFILSIEDYSNHRLSSGLYNITNNNLNTTLSVPDYYNTINVACKLREGSLTAAQIYSINAVTNANTPAVTGFINKLTGPNSGTAFAVIPLSGISALRPDPYIRFGADLNIYKRNYLSPTNLQRFNVTLTDDKGNLVNLYDNDWSFSLIVEERLN
jgi:hypothetical protein